MAGLLALLLSSLSRYARRGDGVNDASKTVLYKGG